MYADDSKICCPITNPEDCLSLQESLNGVWKWCKEWGMSLNLDKCYIMNISRSKRKILFNYNLDSIILKNVTSTTDLGLLVTNTLNWDLQIEKMVKKASARLGLVKRCLGNSVKSDVKLLAYKSLVRPLLEYGSILWSHPNKKSTMALERIQRRSTQYIVNYIDLDYKNRLVMCDMLPLSLRREYLDLVFLYNIIQGLVDIDVSLCFQGQVPISIPIRIFARTEQCMKFFTSRIYYMWNQLPQELRDTELNMAGRNTLFKKLLKEWLNGFFYTRFDNYNTCSWVLKCRCHNCRPM
jgi:hypothetical protein